MAPYIPKYTSPAQAAENRARWRARLFWIAVALPVAFALIMFGYSDQAPTALREFTVSLDRALGQPILALIRLIASR